MAKFKTITVDLYKRDITVFIGSHDEFKRWIISYELPDSWKSLVENVVQSDDRALASYWYNNNNGNGIIELPKHPEKPNEIAVAAHECLHATMRALSYVDISCYNNEPNEPYTYMLEYILEKVLDYKNYELFI